MKLKILTLFLCCFSLVSVWSQSNISGTVTDELAMPLPGVNVLVKGTSTGSVTDFDGQYTVTAEKGAILQFSFVGFQSQDITVSDIQKPINLVMKEDASALEEVVVVGYGKQKKESVLGAINSVKGSEILKSGSSNVSNALSGVTPGLDVVQSTSEPGADDGEIFIRGNSNPLILVDGVEIVGGFSYMDPNDIENISILKDGAATAVYGIRGANGVIIITTKRGKIGKPKVNFTSEFSIKTYPDTYDALSAYDAQKAFNVGLYNDAAFSGGYSTESQLAHWRDGDLPYIYPNTDWVDYTTKDFATSFSQNVSVSGGTDFVKYYASAGYLHEGDITEARQFFNFDPEYNFQRFSFRGNLDFKLSKTTRLKTSVSSRLEDRNKSGNANSDPSFLGLYTTAPGGAVPYYPAEAMELYPDPNYPGLAEIRFPISGSIGNNLEGSANLLNTIFSIDFELEQDLDFVTKGLMFTAKYNYISNYETSQTTTFDSSLETRIDRYDLLPDGTWDSFEGPDYERPFDFNVNDENISNSYEITNTRAQLFYERTFGKHAVTGLALFSRQEKISNTQFPFYNEDWVGRATYNYDTRYFFEISGSYNGDETFAEGYRFKLFPSISVGVNLAKEKFVQNILPQMNNFKIRYSYGETGSKTGLGNDRWQYLSYFDRPTTNAELRPTSRFYFGEGDTDPLYIIQEDQLGNPLLTWATVSKENIGVDFGFFNNNISGSIDFFKDHREDLIDRLQIVPSYFGSSASLPYANLGISESHGYEISLTYQNRTASGFSYSATGFYAFNENRILKSAADGPGTPEYTQIANKPNGASALLQTDGYFQNIDELLNYPVYSGNPGLGDYRYVDYNANGTIIGVNTEDMVRFDLPDSPRNSYSLRLNAGFKGWSISALINGIEGHKGLVNADLAYAIPNGEAAGRYDQLDYWTPSNPNAAYPALHIGTANPNLAAATTARIIDLDYIKLRSLDLGYDFDMENSPNISRFKIYVSGSNLFTISDLDYADPEGNTPGAYPILRRFNLGLTMSF
ncbi:SusC/RagA family TonB-linked outer membrane protein [Formosa undariae]|uniref:SusC/RagA family TonB-linked outer membrane protein n=1 Tax=Formosa undariae TaxID=1325436 RepID=A0ABV5EZY3_9FLAO